GPGNCGALRLGGGGADVYVDNLKYGYRGRLAVGTVVDTEPGNMSGPTRTGVRFCLDSCPHSPPCTIDHWERGCPRILILPVCSLYEADATGVTRVRIEGFAAFLVEDLPGSGNECLIRGRFIRTVKAGEGGPGQPYFGVSVVRLKA
ncbi:MAG: hypothetical protein H5T97_02055, partial [Firmicutes bacterium]|nr:hypothetical protein [Bacillota bacterium]